jgi:hypothetical protein
VIGQCAGQHFANFVGRAESALDDHRAKRSNAPKMDRR